MASPSTAKHGTVARYKKHVRDKDSPCQPCKDANNEYSKKFYEDTQARERLRLYNRATSRAIIKLKALHQREFYILLNNELIRIQREVEAANGKGKSSSTG